MKGQPITGGCYCGNVRFRTTHKPMHQANCHCANCRRAAGAQAVAWITVPQSSFENEKGKLKRYRTERGASRTFSDVCGKCVTCEIGNRHGETDISTGIV